MKVRTVSDIARSIVAMATVLGVSGCAVQSDYSGPRFAFTAAYRDFPKGQPVLLENAAWWEKFNDPQLNSLIDRGLDGSIDLKIARERLHEAELAIGEVRPFATTNLNAGISASDDSSRNRNTETDASFGFNTLFDPYGAAPARLRAAAARAEIAKAEVDAARLLLITEIAGAYIDLRFQQRLLVLRRKQLRSRMETRRLVKDLVDQNVGTRLHLVQAEALVSETQALIPTVQSAVRVQKNLLAVLLGEDPVRADMVVSDIAGGLPIADMSSDIGIPADLLRNRPDIFIREREYYAAIAELDASVADLYPRLSLNGTIMVNLSGGNQRTSYTFGPSIQFPSLPNGPRHATVEVRRSQVRQAYALWRQNVLQSIQDVEDSLARYAASRKATGAARRTVRSYAEAVSLTKKLIRQGESTVRDLLEAEQRVAEAETTQAELERQQGRNFVTLNASLGSGNGRGNAQSNRDDS